MRVPQTLVLHTDLNESIVTALHINNKMYYWFCTKLIMFYGFNIIINNYKYQYHTNIILRVNTIQLARLIFNYYLFILMNDNKTSHSKRRCRGKLSQKNIIVTIRH